MALVCFAVTLLCGCQSMDDTLTSTPVPLTLSGPATSAIAGDIVGRLAEEIGPANKTTIKMRLDHSDYAIALEAALKGWGFAVITDGKPASEPKPLELTYALTDLDGQVLAQVTTPSIAIGRTFTPTATGATPASPLSIMRRD